MDGHDVQSLEPVALGGLQECASLIAVQGPHLLASDLRQINVFCDVATHHSPPSGLLESAVQNGVGVLDGAGGQASILHLPVQPLHVHGAQLPKLNLAQGWFQVASHLLPIGFVRACPDAALHAVPKPPIEVLAHGQVLGIEEEPTVSVGEGLVELLGYLLARLAVDGLALGSRCSLDRVAGHVEPILAASNRALAVAALTHHSPFISSFGSTPNASASLRIVTSRAGRCPNSSLFMVS